VGGVKKWLILSNRQNFNKERIFDYFLDKATLLRLFRAGTLKFKNFG